MEKFVKPSKISGQVEAPASKSMVQRALAAALLAEEPTRILNVTYSSDAQAALRVIKALGARVVVRDRDVHVEGGLNPTGEVLNCGESGLSMRMFSAVASLWHRELTLTGEGSLLTRPVSMIEEPLKELGVAVISTNGCPPLTIKGPLQGGEAEIDGSVSSQFLTGLLIALPAAPRDSCLRVQNLKSTPYIDMTLTLLKTCGILVENSDHRVFRIKGNQQYRVGDYRVEGDWSGASFLLVAGALGGSISVTGLGLSSPQADRRIMDALKAAGAGVTTAGSTVEIKKKELKAFDFDATDCPDLFPPLVALACNCTGTTVIKGVERLKHKESNRAAVLQKEFSNLSARIRIDGDLMKIEGTKLTGGTVDSHNDHRIAMAGALAAINAGGEITVAGSECVAKSYPDFFEDFSGIGGIVHE